MKTKELIRQLQKEDPSGEEEVCVGNRDIHFVERLPAFYDGPLQVLIWKDDEIVGAKITQEGYKIRIHTKDIESLIDDKPDIPVEFDGLSINYYKNGINKLRREAVKFWEDFIENHPNNNNMEYYKKLIEDGKKFLEEDK